MKRPFRVSLIAVALMASAAIVEAQQVPDPRVADLVQAGKIRVGLGLGSPPVAIKDPATGEVRGPAVDLGRALAARMGVEFVQVEYPRPGAVMEGVRTGAWDVAFLAIDPSRAAVADFSPPTYEYDLTYSVPAGSAIRKVWGGAWSIACRCGRWSNSDFRTHWACSIARSHITPASRSTRANIS